jgi:C-terminal processing protease CtpA/Prc
MDNSLASTAGILIEDKILKINDIDVDYKNLPEILKDFK